MQEGKDCRPQSTITLAEGWINIRCYVRKIKKNSTPIRKGRREVEGEAFKRSGATRLCGKTLLFISDILDFLGNQKIKGRGPEATE